jgi:hypothetical protein
MNDNEILMDDIAQFKYEDQVLNEKDEPIDQKDTLRRIRFVDLHKLYLGRKVSIDSRYYILIEKVYSKRHMNLKDNFEVPHGLWIAKGVHNKKYYEFLNFKIKKTSPYNIYNGFRFDNHTSIDDLFNQVGISQAGVYNNPYRYLN